MTVQNRELTRFINDFGWERCAITVASYIYHCRLKTIYEMGRKAQNFMYFLQSSARVQRVMVFSWLTTGLLTVGENIGLSTNRYFHLRINYCILTYSLVSTSFVAAPQ